MIGQLVFLGGVTFKCLVNVMPEHEISQTHFNNSGVKETRKYRMIHMN